MFIQMQIHIAFLVGRIAFLAVHGQEGETTPSWQALPVFLGALPVFLAVPQNSPSWLLHPAFLVAHNQEGLLEGWTVTWAQSAAKKATV